MQSQQKEKIEKTHMQEEQTQSNRPQIMGGETGSRKMITQLNKSHLKQAEMQGNEAQNKRRESETSKMPIRQDRIIETQSQSGEMMIKNTQNKKENAKNESMLSEQYIHKKNIIETQSQSGRSMVEMLGVLAIIGVLSIGGIAGYKYAMNYYQANQIAHEMNIMRTDAKIKIAQGAEELILGNPYDDGNINFNNYETDFDCALADDAIIEENVSCRVANAFYIEMKNISQEICRPLSKLIQGMNELIGFEITTETIEADNEECQEGANNIHAVFSAEAISELKSCKENTDCEELENTPYCDKTRHVCVRCYEDNQCAHTEYCEDNTCKSCDEGLVWNGEKCVECTESTDCAETLVCRNNECTTCETEEECQAKGDYHCSSEDTCIQCGANEVWGGKEKGCVECTADSDCTDTPETPVCNTNINKCVECLNDQNCIDKGTDKPICNKDTNICEPCPNGQKWKKSAQGCVSYECRTNADCNPDDGFENYCYLAAGASPTSEWQDDDPNGANFSGECHKVSDDLLKKEPTNIQGKDFYGSNKMMNWWTSCRFCAAHAKKSDEGCVGTADGPSFMAAYHDIDWKCNNEKPASNGKYYCTETDANPAINNVPSSIKQFRKMFDNDENYTDGRWLWLREADRYRGIELSNGARDLVLFRYSTREVDRALCRE